MHASSRLASSLKPKTPWLNTPRSAFTRLARFTRRLLAPVIELDSPRGAGAAGATLIVLGSIGYGVAAGEHIGEIASEVRHVCDAVSNSAGLRITSIALDGEHELSRAGILALAGIEDTSSLHCLDAASARSALTRNPWIADATVLKLYPGRLRISVTERTPLALWQKDGRVSLIAADGTVLQGFDGSRFAGLPLIVGDGAAPAARDFLDVVGRYPLIREAVEASVFVAERRWNLRLKSGLEIKLPDTDAEQALQRLVALDRDKKLLSRDIAVVDLRLQDRVIVKLSDAAAAARAVEVKELLKKEKPKKKGSEA
jgi:cell division protein FtsQ